MARPRKVDDPQLLEAAMHAFWQGGYEGVGTRDLEAVTGLPASSLYHRYGSKERLFAAALSQYLDQVIERRIVRYLQQEDARTGLRGFLVSIYGGRGGYHACLLANTWNEPVARQPEVAAVLAAGTRRLEEAFRGTLLRGIGQGAFRASLDVEAAARFLLTALLGLLAAGRISRDMTLLEAEVDLFLGALA